MRKKLLSLALALVMTLTLLPASALAEEPATDGTAPVFTAVPQTATIFDKTVSDLQDTDIEVGTATANGYPVTGTVKYVKDWAKFNESNKDEQTGFYVALSIPGSIGADAAKQTIKGMKLPANGGTETKTYEGQDLTNAFTDGTNKNECYTAFFLGATEAAAKEKTIKISLKYGDAAGYTDYTFSFAGLTYTGAPIEPATPAITAVESKTSGVTATLDKGAVTLSGELAAPATGTAGTVTLGFTYTDATGAKKTKDVDVSLTYAAADGTNPASWTIPADVTVDGELKATLKGTVSVKTTQPTDKVIESVAITLVPSAGVNVGDTLPTATTETEGVTLKTEWKNGNNAAVTKADAAGTYTATITVTAKTGYTLKAEGVEYTIDGKTAEKPANVETETLTYTLEVKPATPTLTFAVYNVTAEDIADLGGVNTVEQLGAFTMSTSGTTVTVTGTADYVSLSKFNGIATEENKGHYLPISITGKAGDVITLTNRSDGAKNGKDFTLGADGKLDTIVWLDGDQKIDGLDAKTFTVKVTRDGESTTYTVNFSKVTLAAEGTKPATKHIVTLTEPENGTLSATVKDVPVTTGGTVVDGEDVVITATPSTGYQFKSLTVNGTPVAENDLKKNNDGSVTYTIKTLSENVTVVVVFEQKPAQSYSITVTEIETDADSKPIGSVTIAETAKAGDTVEFTVTPASGYTTKSVVVKNGDTVIQTTTGDNGKYTFTMPAANVTITAVFEKVTPDAPSVDANVPVTPNVSGDTATATVNDNTVDAAINAAIDKAVADAASKGETLSKDEVTVGEVTINATSNATGSDNVKTAEVTLPTATVGTLVDKKVETVTVATNVGTVSLPQEVLTENKTSDLKLIVKEAETTITDQDTKDQIKATFDVSVQKVVTGNPPVDAEIKDLKTPITLSFKIATGLSNVMLAYVDGSDIKKIASSDYNPTTGIITGTITHLTEIVVVNPEAISDYYTISGTTDGTGGAGKTLVVNLTGNYDGKQVVTACFTYKLDNGTQIVTSMTQTVVKGTKQANFSYSGTPAKIVLYVSSSLPNLTGGNLNTTVYDSVTK